jgi:hypothetical protein
LQATSVVNVKNRGFIYICTFDNIECRCCDLYHSLMYIYVNEAKCDLASNTTSLPKHVRILYFRILISCRYKKLFNITFE